MPQLHDRKLPAHACREGRALSLRLGGTKVSGWDCTRTGQESVWTLASKGNSSGHWPTVAMAIHLLISTLFALLLASASIFYAFVWCLSYTLFFSSANCSILLPRRRQLVFYALLPTLGLSMRTSISYLLAKLLISSAPQNFGVL